MNSNSGEYGNGNNQNQPTTTILTTSTTTHHPKFICACDAGYYGNRCEYSTDGDNVDPAIAYELCSSDCNTVYELVSDPPTHTHTLSLSLSLARFPSFPFSLSLSSLALSLSRARTRTHVWCSSVVRRTANFQDSRALWDAGIYSFTPNKHTCVHAPPPPVALRTPLCAPTQDTADGSSSTAVTTYTSCLIKCAQPVNGDTDDDTWWSASLGAAAKTASGVVTAVIIICVLLFLVLPIGCCLFFGMCAAKSAGGGGKALLF
jgi:hypothetical protein